MILDGLEYKLLREYKAIDYRGIAYNSNKIEKDYIFVAIPGFNIDGHEFIQDAILKGAKLIICQKNIVIKEDVNVILVKDSREALSIVSSNFYNYPQNLLTIIGITGTNGKTTTAYIIYKSLDNVAYIGTIGSYINSEKFSSNLTTPESLDLIIFFKECLKKNIKYVVMEVSSHALILKRVNNLKFKIGIFTNLTKDHLNIHGNLESYFKAKTLLTKLIKKDGFIIVNIDDPYFIRLKSKNMKTISTKGGNITGKIVNYVDLKSIIQIKYENYFHYIKSNLIMSFNLYNIMCSFQALIILGFSIEYIIEKIENIKSIPGRLNLISNKNKKVVIDFAHSPDSIEKVSKGLKEIFGEVIAVFGSGGGRDKSIREEFAKSASYNSSFIILTSDNPRNEKVDDIINKMEDGLLSIGFSSYIKINDRKEAIKYGINILKENQVLLIAGKGHQNYEIIGEKINYFNEYDIVQEELNNQL